MVDNIRLTLRFKNPIPFSECKHMHTCIKPLRQRLTIHRLGQNVFHSRPPFEVAFVWEANG
jgi:hypothetical protein